MSFAIEQDECICLQLEITSDLGCVQGAILGFQLQYAMTYPAFQRLSDLLRSGPVSSSVGARICPAVTVLGPLISVRGASRMPADLLVIVYEGHCVAGSIFENSLVEDLPQVIPRTGLTSFMEIVV